MAAGDSLPVIGVCSYGKHVFNSTVDTTGIKITPVYDASGRTVTHSVYEISLSEVIGDNSVNTGVMVQAAVAELQKPGLPLRYSNRGVGNLAINTGGRASDVVWGPRCGPVGITPLGNGQAVKLTWSVQVAMPSCDDAAFGLELMEFVYKLQYKVARNGDTTRVYSGHLKIPNRRKTVGGRDVFDSPDNYREKIVPPLIEGFARGDRVFDLSEDRTTLTFSITDEQLPPNVPPRGVTLCTASQEYTCEKICQWAGVIEAEYELLRGLPPAVAVQAFLSGLVADRISQLGRLVGGAGLPRGPVLGPLAGLRPGPVAAVPVKFTAGEPTIYGPGNMRVKMSLSFYVAGVGIGPILAFGGLWRPAPGSNWKTWVGSVATALSSRGSAALTWRTNEDKLIDLCGHPQPVPTAPAPRPAFVGPPAPPPGWGVWGASPSGPLAGLSGFAGPGR